MKSLAFGLAAVLFAGNAFAQTAPAPAADQQAAPAEQAQATPAAEGAAPTVPVQTPKSKNTASIVIGAVGAAALLGAATHGGGSDNTPPPVQPSKPSSP